GCHDSLCFIDQFVWRSAHSLNAKLPLRRGDDFQPYFESTLRPLYPRIRLIRTVINKLVWSEGPIEILVLDAPKTLEDTGPGLALMLFDQGEVKEACKAIRAARFDPAMAARWQRYSSTPFYDLYTPLFESLGIRPNRSTWQRVRSIKRKLRRRIWRRLVPKK